MCFNLRTFRPFLSAVLFNTDVFSKDDLQKALEGHF